jgi:CBS-domain-containing membrane protein
LHHLRDEETGIDCLPVTSDDGTLMGIATQSDLLELLARYLDEGELAVVSTTVPRNLQSAS